MVNPEYVRHSLAHLLSAAVLELWPGAKNTIGPAIENGFYYDFDFVSPISDTDLPKVEKKMRQLLQTWQEFSSREVSTKTAKEFYNSNPYKLELIDEITAKGEKITLYKSGNYEDLCRGGHVDSAREIKPDAFKLTHTAGAYWRGSEKNKMLTRIYGLAFATKDELDAHLKILEEAKKRDHKKIGPELDLFVFSDLVGPGLPLFTPRGTLVRNLLDDRVWQLRKAHGYQQVDIPHITRKELYEKSGHWDKFKDDLFRITTREGHEFALKPMNCPHHAQIFNRKQHSYRELPQRYANTTKVYRDEQTGELSGLTRVRSITQDDAHVFCRTGQVKDEFQKIWNIVHEFYGSFGFTMRVRLSLHDPVHPEKYLGGTDRWKQAEELLRQVAKENKANSFEAVGEANFYGPKLDFMAKDAIGREHQVATIQLDMNLPERFDLTCTNDDGKPERIVMIHAAIMGSLERFMAVLVEHTAGAFPSWLSPDQVEVIPISEKHTYYAKKIARELHDNGIRSKLNLHNDTIGKKIRGAELQKIPYLLIVGDKEVKSKKVAVRKRGEGDLGAMSLKTFLAKLSKEK